MSDSKHIPIMSMQEIVASESTPTEAQEVAWSAWQVLGAFFGINGPSRVCEWFFDIARGEKRKASELFPITIEELEAYGRKPWESWGIVEIAVRNPEVAEYCQHWEKRTESAEQRLSQINKIANALLTEGYKLGGLSSGKIAEIRELSAAEAERKQR